MLDSLINGMIVGMSIGVCTILDMHFRSTFYTKGHTRSAIASHKNFMFLHFPFCTSSLFYALSLAFYFVYIDKML